MNVKNKELSLTLRATNSDGFYRIKYYNEVDELTNGKNIVRFVKAQRLRRLGYALQLKN